MKYMRLSGSGLCVGAVFMLCVLLPLNAAASTSADKVIRFGICPANIKSVLVTKEVGANVWHLVITLNSVGTEKFRQLQKKYFGEFVELAWDGVSFGRRRFDLAGLAGLKQLHLQSQGWLSHRAVEAQMKLLGNKSLDVPCGQINKSTLPPINSISSSIAH